MPRILSTTTGLTVLRLLLLVGVLLFPGCRIWSPGHVQHWQRPIPPSNGATLGMPEGIPYQSNKPQGQAISPWGPSSRGGRAPSVPTETGPAPGADESFDLDDGGSALTKKFPTPVETLPSPPAFPAPKFDDSPMPVESLPVPRSEEGGPRFAPVTPPTENQPVQVELALDSPTKKQIGSPGTFDLRIMNHGQEGLSDLVVYFKIQEPLTCPGCTTRTLRQPIEFLAAGESKVLPVSVESSEVGTFWCEATLKSGDRELVWKRVDIEFVREMLSLEIVGPAERTVESRAEYTIKIMNLTEQVLSGMEIRLQHDDVLKRAAITVGSQKTPRGVMWLETLQPGEQVQHQVEFECPVSTEQTVLSLTVTGEQVPTEQRELTLRVRPNRGPLFFGIADLQDPLTVGEVAQYDVTVRNGGYQSARDIFVAFEWPDGMEFLSATLHQGEQQLQNAPETHEKLTQFAKVSSLAPDAELRFRVQLRVERAGDLRVVARLKHDGGRNDVETTEFTTVNAGTR